MNPDDPQPPPPQALLDRHPQVRALMRPALLSVAVLVLCPLAHAVAGGGLSGLAAALGVAAGLGIGALAREGPASLAAALIALVLALWLRGVGVSLALSTGVVCAVLTTSAALVLTRATAFDWRLERPRDLLWLLGATLGVAFPLAFVLPILHARFGSFADPTVPRLAVGTLLLSGALLTALPLCSAARPTRWPEAPRLALLACWWAWCWARWPPPGQPARASPIPCGGAFHSPPCWGW